VSVGGPFPLGPNEERKSDLILILRISVEEALNFNLGRFMPRVAATAGKMDAVCIQKRQKL
jgi:hypothetical protein